MRELPTNFQLQHRSHSTFNQGACLLEAVAYVAGEDHSDQPRCVSDVLASIGRQLNDSLSFEDRQKLLPLIPKLIGTAQGRELEDKRAYKLLDILVREIVPRLYKSTDRNASFWKQLQPITCIDDAKQLANEVVPAAPFSAPDLFYGILRSVQITSCDGWRCPVSGLGELFARASSAASADFLIEAYGRIISVRP